MAIHVDLSDLGTPQLDDLLAKDQVWEARLRLEKAINDKILDLRSQGCTHVHIVRWTERDESTFRFMAQIFEPYKEQEARALAAEKHGEIEIVEFREPPEIDIVYPWQRPCGGPADGKAQA